MKGKSARAFNNNNTYTDEAFREIVVTCQCVAIQKLEWKVGESTTTSSRHIQYHKQSIATR